MSVKRLINALARRVIWFLFTMIIYSFRIFPIKKNKILFVNYYGKGYGDNAKYICEQLLVYRNRLDLVWAVQKKNENLPQGVRTVKYKSLHYYYELCTARVWVDNCRKPLYERKRKGQYYIQTWHADMGIKKAEGEAIDSLYPSYVKGAKNDSKMADLFICGNKWMIDVYRNAYWYSGKIYCCGYPRRDILYNITRAQCDEIKKAIGIKNSIKVLLYAPTFRKTLDLNVYNLDWERILSSLSKKFGGNWIGMIRLHPNISKHNESLKLPECVYNVTEYPDMQELLAISDVCVTDYSSSILEFGVTGKPAFIYASDYEEYKKDRDVNFDLYEMPFPFAENNSELITNIMNFDSGEYAEAHYEFYDKKIGMFESGNASEKIANIILEKCS